MYHLRSLVMAFFLLCSLSGVAGVFTLFSDDVKEEYPSVLYDFLERYLYELDSLQRRDGTLGNRLVDDKVTFIKGSPTTARSITPEHPFTISRMESMYYDVTWTDTLYNELLHIVFPASFELILGMPKNQIEKTLRRQLQTMSEEFTPDSLSLYSSVEQTDDGYFVSTSEDFLGIEELNTYTYFTNNGDANFTPVFTSLQNEYSAKNLLQGVIKDCNDYKLYVIQNLYDFRSEDFTLKLSQWLNYCRSIHATVYVAIEEEREDGLMVLLVAQSSELGFQHAMSLILPWNFVDKQDCTIKGKLNAFIPIHNVKTLYQENLDGSKRKKKGYKWHEN